VCDGLVKKADREALAAGVPVKVVSEQLGHAGVALTLDVYSHVLPHMQDDAAERVEALLRGPVEAASDPQIAQRHTGGTHDAQGGLGRPS